MNHSDVNVPARLSVARGSHSNAGGLSDRVYNLMVLVQQTTGGETVARSANLAISEVRASSVRSALSGIVTASRALIGEHLAQDTEIPWLDPPATPAEAESRFLVPLHL